MKFNYLTIERIYGSGGTTIARPPPYRGVWNILLWIGDP